MVKIGLAFGTQLWLNWAEIALDHRDEARAARETAGGPGPNPELQASMVAIVAMASAIDGFATFVRDAGVQLPPVPERPRSIVVWDTLHAGFTVESKTNSWPPALKKLWRLRSGHPDGGLVHPKTQFGEPTLIPSDSRILSPARETYTVGKQNGPPS